MNAAGEDERNLLVSNGSDWGCNAISNGGNARNFGWRTLTDAEWQYLIYTRKVQGETGRGHTCVWVTLDSGIKGYIIFHDNYVGPTTGLTAIPEGCVFLPAAGQRKGVVIGNPGSSGCYWASTHRSSSQSGWANYLVFSSSNIYMCTANLFRYNGNSVRLVYDK